MIHVNKTTNKKYVVHFLLNLVREVNLSIGSKNGE